MYTPEYFRESDKTRLETFIRQNAFATLISVDDGIPFASHLPMLFDPNRGEKGALIDHMARANPQCTVLITAFIRKVTNLVGTNEEKIWLSY